MQLATFPYVSGNDTNAVLVRIIVQWARDNRLVFQNSQGKLTRLNKKQLLSICEQLRYTPRMDTQTARNVFADMGIVVRMKTQYEIDGGF